MKGEDMPKWERVNSIRMAVELFFQENQKQDNVNIPIYDQFITETRAAYEELGFDMSNPDDVYKSWAFLERLCASGGELLRKCNNADQFKGALKVIGGYGNMTGMFLREMTRYLPDVPEIQYTGRGMDGLDEES